MNITRITICACFLFTSANFCFCSAERPLCERIDKTRLEEIRNAFRNGEIVIKYFKDKGFRVGIVPQNGIPCNIPAKNVSSWLEETYGDEAIEQQIAQQIIKGINLGAGVVVKSSEAGLFFGGNIISQPFHDIGSLCEFFELTVVYPDIIGPNEKTKEEGIMTFPVVDCYVRAFLQQHEEEIDEIEEMEDMEDREDMEASWSGWATAKVASAGTKTRDWLAGWFR
jgi:hypothetical protein